MAPYPPSNQRSIQLLEEIKEVGFPNKKNIKILQGLIDRLNEQAPLLSSINKESIQEIDAVMQQIIEMLKKEGEISVSLYTVFFAKLVILETNLYSS